jgi:hypothetical protein
MTSTKSLLLGAVATLAFVAGAQAADLPSKNGAPAAEYVKVCHGGDFAGFVIPGADACVKISGYVSAEIAMGVAADPYWASASQWRTASRRAGDIDDFTRGQVDFDAVANTAMGPLLAHIGLRANSGDSRFDATPAAAVNAAYVQWAGFTVGKHSSFYWPSP